MRPDQIGRALGLGMEYHVVVSVRLDGRNATDVIENIAVRIYLNQIDVVLGSWVDHPAVGHAG